jgi:steroid 5-alpha reductase family enzyme
MVWMTQALWVTLNAGPIYLMILNRSKDNEIGTKELIGIGLFILGFLLEVIADNQKFSFR